MSDQDRGQLVIPTEKIPPSVFQAIYRHIMGKTGTLRRSFKGTFRVTLNDIHDLYRQVEQSVAQYQVNGRKCEISLTLSNGEIQTYESFDKFNRMNFNTFSQETKNIGFEYDFMVLPPAETEDERIPQRYRINVYLRSWEDDEGDVIIEGNRFIREIRITSSPITVDIEYSDYAVARHLQALANDWIDRIRFQDETALSAKWIKHIGRISNALFFGLIGAVLVGCVIYEPHYYRNIVSPMRFLVIVIVLLIGSLVFLFYIDNKKDKLIKTLTPRTFILLTHGDDEARAKLLRDRVKAKKTMAFLFSSVILAMLVALTANYLSSRLFSNISNPSGEQRAKGR